MDVRALFAAVSVSAGLVLLASAVVASMRRRKSFAPLWIYAVLFAAVGFVLWRSHLRSQPTLAPVAVNVPSVLTMPEPVDSIAVQPVPTVKPKPNKPPPQVARSTPLTPEWQAYQVLSQALEQFFERNGTAHSPDSVSASQTHDSAGTRPHAVVTSVPRHRVPV